MSECWSAPCLIPCLLASIARWISCIILLPLELAPVEALELLSVATYLPLGVLVIPGGGPLVVDGAVDEVVDGAEELSVLRFPIAVSRLEGIGGRFEEPEDEVVSEGLTLT